MTGVLRPSDLDDPWEDPWVAVELLADILAGGR